MKNDSIVLLEEKIITTTAIEESFYYYGILVIVLIFIFIVLISFISFLCFYSRLFYNGIDFFDESDIPISTPTTLSFTNQKEQSIKEHSTSPKPPVDNDLESFSDFSSQSEEEYSY